MRKKNKFNTQNNMNEKTATCFTGGEEMLKDNGMKEKSD